MPPAQQSLIPGAKQLESGFSDEVRFEPDIGLLVKFDNRKTYIRNKTQQLIRQSYETYKRRLMTPGGKSSPNAKNDYSLITAMAETGAGKKRRL
jgi:hypothetical protein